ncbi:transcription factor TFIIH complex subunit Tfb5 [Colletotrichum tofieldiae]|nr:transcription factor TFIIH complex subunit Tfb5 [Colletotrichum tofieldiae]
MPRAIRGVLIECDPSIKSIIVNIDSNNHDYIIEDLDDQHVVVKENMVAALKRQLDEVGFLPYLLVVGHLETWACTLTEHHLQRLKETQQPDESSDSD